MKMNRTRVNLLALATAIGTAVATGWAANGIDNVSLLVNSTTATNGASFGAFAYNPITDTAYVVGFGGSGQLTKITGVTSGSPVNVDALPNAQVTATQYTRFEWTNGLDGSGNPIYPAGVKFNTGTTIPNNIAGGQYTVGGILLNPIAVGTIAPYSQAWFTDAASTVNVNSGTLYYDFTKRNYTWDLTQDLSAQNSAIPHFKALTSKNDYATAISASPTSSDNIGRQPSWSGDGQSIYQVQAGTTFGGLWKMNATTGALARIVADPNANMEPAVVSSGGIDKVYMNGTITNGNAGGLSYYTVNGNTVSLPVAVKTQADIISFLETTSTAGSFFSSVALSDGTIIANFVGGSTNQAIQSGPNPTPSNPGGVLIAIAPDGSMYKVTDSRERGISVGTPTASNFGVNSNILRMQPPIMQTFTSSSNFTFQAPTILYDESSPINGIASVTVFKPGDFNRDNSVDATDIGLFQNALGLRNSSTAATFLKYDLNGNGSVDWKDVKLLQQFYAFPNGDANMDKKVDQTDLNTFEANWRNTSATWIKGKFDGGSGATPWTDPKANTVGASDLTIIAANWDSGVASSNVTRFIADFTAAKVTSDNLGISLTTGDVATLAARSVATGGTKVIVTPSLAIAPGAKIDLVDNDFILKSSIGSVAADYSSVAGFVSTGRAGGTWAGAGITSSAAQAQAALHPGNEPTSLAVVINGNLVTPFTTFDDVPVDAYSILVKYTYPGDTTLKGSINFDDYLAMDHGYLAQLSGWQNGDFNGDGTVNVADYALADYAYFNQGGTLASELISEHAAEFGDAYTSLVPSLIPEPASLLMLSLGCLSLYRRQNGRNPRKG